MPQQSDNQVDKSDLESSCHITILFIDNGKSVYGQRLNIFKALALLIFF